MLNRMNGMNGMTIRPHPVHPVHPVDQEPRADGREPSCHVGGEPDAEPPPRT
jgi:hypothetical protein